MKAKVNKISIEILQADILSLDVSCFVNATDSNLTLTPALLAKTGNSVQLECTQIRWCEVGSAVITNAGKHKAQKIIHAVGPRWGEGSERGKLANATWQALMLAENHGLDSIALPAISTGALGYPLENCATTMLNQIIDFTFEKVKALKTIILCVDNEVTLEGFCREFQNQLEALNQSGEAKVRV